MNEQRHNTQNNPSVSSHQKPPARLPWMEWKVGDRVTIRRREADGLYDAVGYLVEVCPDYVVVDTRKGHVKVPAEKMVVGKKIPPPPRYPISHDLTRDK